MPVYEYRCTSCNQQFEYEHRMSEKKTVCEACQGALERLISRTSFSFKGGGWYKDLYASPKPGASSSEGSSPSPSSSAANDSSSSSASTPASTSTPTSTGGSGSGSSSSSGVAAAA
jgi:putative FmdB family regulatory protein